MNIILTTINSKYIHTNLALYLLYSVIEDEHNARIIEFTSKEKTEDIVSSLINTEGDIFCFSVYIWNVEQTFEVIKGIKEIKKDVKIIVGGPEVSYDSEYFIEKYHEIDYLISGEGEEVFSKLIDAISKNENINSLNVITKSKLNGHSNKVDLNWLTTHTSPYRLLTNLNNRIVYFESSRGCPYNCSFCLSSLESGVRFYDIEYIKNELLYLINNNVKVVKFLDRTFNTKLSFAYEIFDFIIKNHKKGQTFQFEITGDILPKEIIEYLNKNAPENLFRFEIGIQSTNDLTNKLVDRVQNLDKLLENIKLIQDKGIIDLHLDLIAGLPKEDFDSFKKTFNDIFRIKPHELQLGFLKMLRGTKIRNEANKYNYKYHSISPYEIISHQDLSEEDIHKIHLAEEGLEKYWNKHKTDSIINYLTKENKDYFSLFLDIGIFWEDNYKIFTSFQLVDLYERLYLFTKTKYDNHLILLDLIKFDYLTNTKTKPKRFYDTLPKQQRNKIFKQILDSEEHDYKMDDLYKYSYLEELHINPLTYELEHNYLIVTYKNNNPSYKLINK